ncbi:MAG: DUF167 domain-containing protein [bacterium]|nr:DUF167 domain-containing protein [bacterium]
MKITNQGLFLTVKIIPNSSKNDITIEDEYIKVKVTAQPIENKANKALIELLSKKLKIAKTNIEITKGLTSKEKTVLIKITDIKKQNEIKELLIK